MKSIIWTTLILALLAAGIFLLDLAAPANAAYGTMYVAVVLGSLLFRDRRAIPLVALICTVMIFSAAVTVLLAPPADAARSAMANTFIVHRNPSQVLINAFLELFAIWVSAVFGYHIKRLERDLLAARDELQERFERRSAELRQVNANLLTEIDRREQTRQELHHSEAHYLSLIENLPIYVIRKDVQGRFTFASPSFCDLLGKSSTEILGRTDFDFYPRELAEKYRQDDLHVIRNLEVLNEVETNQPPKGAKTSVQVIKVPVINLQGNVIGIQGIFWDVTERMKAEDELRESEARKHAILESAMDSIVFLDGRGYVVEVNRAALETLQCSRREIMQSDLADLFRLPAFRQQLQRSLSNYASRGVVDATFGKRMEVGMRRLRGQDFLAELSVQPIPVQGGRAFAIFFRDITERKRAEEAILRARDAAEAANRAKSLFLTNMSHEIRTPMNAIIGITDLLINSRVSTEQRQYLSLIQESADSLLDVINDILDFSKIEAGKLDLDATEFDLYERLSDAMRSLAVRADGKGLELACQIDPQVPRFVISDDTRLRQVLVNLVGNAIKFTNRGEIVVRVTQLSREKEHVVLRFVVSDTGIGIPPDRKQAIFAAFEQADNSTTRQFGGTGLGLAISSRLVQMLGGRMWVDSEVDRGSKFYFTTRFGLSTERPQQWQVDEALDRLPVLVVDDNQTYRDILVHMLQHWGLEPFAVAGAEDALRHVRACRHAGQPVPLLVVDSQMPVMDGFLLAETLRQEAECRIVMLLTPTNRSGSVAHCEELGLAAYLLKPVNPAELLDALTLAVKPLDAIAAAEVEFEPATVAQRPLNILLAEDSLVNQKLALGLLSREGHRVETANNGKEAIEAASRKQYDLVLMDVQMPEMDGLEATRVIRNREERTGRRIPIIAMTAHAMKGYRETCLEAGMDGYISKPIRTSQLIKAIDEVLGPQHDAPATRHRLSSDPHEVIADASVVVDWKRALEVVQGDRELLREIVVTFLEECNSMVGAIREAIENHDSEALHRAAHTLKGSMRYFGAQAAFERALELEGLGKDADFDAAHEKLPLLHEELDRLLPLLTAFTQTGQFAYVP